MTHCSSPCTGAITTTSALATSTASTVSSTASSRFKRLVQRLTATIEEHQASELQALRAHIANFTQLDGEFYYQAWDRFNDLLVECPQHGFNLYDLLKLFYEGLQLQMQEFINTEGDFFNKEPEDARLHLEGSG